MNPEEELRARLNGEQCARCAFMRGTCVFGITFSEKDVILVPPCFIPRKAGGDEGWEYGASGETNH